MHNGIHENQRTAPKGFREQEDRRQRSAAYAEPLFAKALRCATGLRRAKEVRSHGELSIPALFLRFD